MMRRSVDLPQPGGTQDCNKLAGRDVQIDAIERSDRPGKDPTGPHADRPRCLTVTPSWDQAA